MNEVNSSIGKTLIVIGALLILVGVFFLFANRIPFIGRLPGDIVMKRKNFTIYFPLMTSIIISIVLTLIFYFMSRFRQ